MRAVIIANGEIGKREHYAGEIKEDDFIICADGGYAHAQVLGLVPDVVLGDFDSFSKDEVRCATVKVYPVHKDKTDTEIAVDYALEHGYQSLLLIGCIGSRIDHTLANLFLLKKIYDAGAVGTVLNGHNRAWYSEEKVCIDGAPGETVSVVPLSGCLENVHTKGMYYPLSGDTLVFGSSRGISNQLTQKYAEVTFSSGRALVIAARD